MFLNEEKTFKILRHKNESGEFKDKNVVACLFFIV